MPKPAPIDDSVIIEFDEMWHFLRSKKYEFGPGRPIAEPQNSSSIGNAEHKMRKRLEKCTRLKKWNEKVFFSDRYSVYRDFIPPRCLIQTKSETHLIESDNSQQRHWFARFRWKICCVFRSLEIIDLTMFLYASFHVNKSIDTVI